jgi:hypothetical protein
MAEAKTYPHDIVRIIPVNPKISSQALSGKYSYNGEFAIATSKYTWVKKPATGDPKTNPHPQPHDLIFNNNIKVHTFEVSKERTDQTPDGNIEMYRMIREFYENHPDTMINGVPHKRTRSDGAAFNIVWESVEQKQEKDTYEQIINALTLIRAMKFEEQCNLLYYFGQTARGLKPLQVEQALIGKKIGEGIVFKRTNNTNNIEVLEKIAEGKMTHFDEYVNVRKGIAYKLVESRRVGKSIHYYFAGEFAGLNEQDIVQYFLNNPHLYKTLCDQVEMVDKGEIRGAKLEVKDIREGITAENLKERMKALKERGLWESVIPPKINPDSEIGQQYLEKIEKLERQQLETL